MTAQELISQGKRLFDEEKYPEAIDKLNEALGSIADNTQHIQEQINAQFWLGRCYLGQAIKTSDAQTAKSLFDKAIEHFTKDLELAKQLTDKQKSIEEQGYAQHWLGRCYLEQAINTSNKETATLLFDNAIEHHTKELELAKQLTDEQKRIEQQVYAQSALGRCYFEQAIKTSNAQTAKSLFDKAIKHCTKWFELATQLTDKQKRIEQQGYAQSALGRCYFEQAIKTSDAQTAKSLFDKAIKHYTEQLRLAKQLADEQKSIEQQNNTLHIIYICYFKKSEKQKDFSEYFNYKKTHIATELSEKLTSSLKSEICSILSVLQITPIELGKTPLAHYTNAHVNDILFGLAKQEDSDKNKFYNHMRMTSATYMNDPTEGKSLFELLGHPEVTLDNILELSRKNAFFTCLSSRVNDLNQFRLYGKENSIEASGCCLVFNKNKQWLKQPNTVSSFFSKNDKIQEIENPIESNHENLPLYQIAYIAYVDQYINTKNCLKITKKFHVLLNHTLKNSQLNKMRENILSESLKDLESKLCNKKDLSLDEKQDLEYVRYLFKDFAFRDEEEFRLLKIAEIGKETEYCDKTNSVFVPYADISNMVDEVILGTNYEKTNQKRKVEVFRHKMKEHFPDVKITHSSLPINANPPTKKDS